MVGIPLSRNLVDSFDLQKCDLKPLWSIPDLDNEEQFLEWGRKAVDFCEQYYSSYFGLQFQNLLVYQGNHWLAQDKYNTRFLDNARVLANRKTPRLVFNHCYDFVEHHVSKATRFRPTVAIFPANREQEDADNAKISKDVLDYIWYINNIDLTLQNWVRYCKVFGEAFLKIDFDKSKGDVHPDWIAMANRGQRVPVIDPNTKQPVMSQAGDPLYIDKVVRTGEITYSVKAPWHWFEQPCSDREDIEWAIEWETVDADYLRAKYPHAADKIRPTGDLQILNDASFDYGRYGNECIVYKLYHDKTEFLDSGRYAEFTRDVILQNGPLPYSHGKRPYIKIHDIDVPDCIRGMSFFQQIFPINHQINACGSLIYKMLVLLSHPKIAMTDGACEMTQLLNEATVLTYQQGSAPPSLLHMSPPIGEPIAWMEKLESIMQKLGGNFEMSRGTAPSGVRAAKALRVLDEQEDKRSYGFITKFNQLGMVENAKMTLSVAGDFYSDSDGRLARVVGRDNEYRMRQFQKSNLSKPYDIRIENTTALSQSPSARFDEVTEMMQTRFDPTAPLTREQYFNLLDLGASDQFKDIVTRAVRCAQSENDDMIAGEPVGPPTEDEDLIIHWKIHMQAPQGRDFKELVPPERKAAFAAHVYQTEYLMFEKAFGLPGPMGLPLSIGNPNFKAQMMAECPNWPVYFKLPVPTMSPMGMPGMGGPMVGMPPDGGNGMLQPSPVGPPPMAGGAPVANPPMNEPPPL